MKNNNNNNLFEILQREKMLVNGTLKYCKQSDNYLFQIKTSQDVTIFIDKEESKNTKKMDWLRSDIIENWQILKNNIDVIPSDVENFEVKNNNVNNVNILETPPQGTIKTDVEKQDIQNITVVKNVDLKPILSPKKANQNRLNYKDISTIDIAFKLLQNGKKINDNEYRFDCFNPHHTKNQLSVYSTNNFKCHNCNVTGSNNLELIKQVLGVDLPEAIKWIKENFDYSNSNVIPSGTSKQSEPELIKKYKGRAIDKQCNKDFRLLAYTENEIEKVKITQEIIDLIRSELNKSYSIKTFELLKDVIFVGKGTKTNKDTQKSFTSLRIFTGYENIVINNDSKITYICEGLTDFLTCVELHKDNFKDYNFIQRHNKNNHFGFDLTAENIFTIDTDDNETNIKKLIQESKQDTKGKKFYIVEFKQDNIKDLSDYHFKMNFDTSKTKEYIEKNKKELVIIPNLPEPLPGDEKVKLEIFSKLVKGDKETIKVSMDKLFKYLENRGFSKEIDTNGTFDFYRKEGNFISNIHKNKMIEFLSNEVKTETPKYLELYTDYKKSNFNSTNYFDTLLNFNFNDLLRDSKDKIHLTFKNCIVEISKDNINIKKYSSEKVLKTDNKHNSINRNFDIDSFNSFTEIDYKNSDVYRFFANVSRNENKEIDLSRLEILQRIFGYYLHKFKNKIYPFAYVLTDFNNLDIANGGSGKGLTCQFLNCYKNLLEIDGKNINADNSRFMFENVKKFNDIVVINDLKPDFDTEILYNTITDKFEIEGKNKTKQSIDFEISPKLVITANRPIKSEGDSSQRRFISFEYSNYYNANNRPNADFKKQLMTDFNNLDWLYSDVFFIECCQKFLQMGAVEKIENTFIDKNRFNAKYKAISDVIEYLTSFFENEFGYIQEIYEINKSIIRNNANGYYIDIEVLNDYCKENFKSSVNNQNIKTKKKFSELLKELNKEILKKEIDIMQLAFGSFGSQTKKIYCYKVTDLELQKEISDMIENY